MEQYTSNAITFYQKKDTGEYFNLKEKKGFMVILENDNTKEIIKTTAKKLESDYDLVATTIHPEK
jgi:hypothetical protein